MALAPRKTVLVPGPAGVDGTDGTDGAEGKEGPAGKDGADGKAGSPGPPGPAAPPVAAKAVKAPTAYRVKEEATISLGGAMATFRKGQILRPEFFGPGRFEQVLASCSNSLEPVE
jgi:hypothetical protein